MNKKRILLLYICTICIVLTSCKKAEPKQTEAADNPVEATFIGIITKNTKDYKDFKVLNIANGQTVTLEVNGGVDIRDRYGDAITINQLELGMPVNITCNPEKRKALTINETDEMWERKNTSDLKIDKTDRDIILGSTKYNYASDVVVVSNNKLIKAEELFSMDRVTLRGYKKQVYSIVVEQGHGYIQLRNYSYYIGGTMSAQGVAEIITSSSMVMSPEGPLRLSIRKGSVNISKQIVVLRDEVSLIDMAEFKDSIAKMGSVEFFINPSDSTLLINGRRHGINNLISLEYGQYQVQIYRDGYITQTSILEVSKAYTRFTATLIAEGDTGDGTSSGNTGSGGNQTGSGSNNQGNNNTGSGNSGSSNNDDEEENDNKDNNDSNDDIKNDDSNNDSSDKTAESKVETPKGAKVYLDGVLLGTAPVSFENVKGTHTLTFIKSGFVTKSYSIIINDITKSNVFHFEDLVAK